jgi:hypothetical protein
MSRLDRLRELRKRVDAEIAAEEAALRRRARLTPAVPPGADRELLPELGAPAPEIRDWARSVGMNVPQNGRLPEAVKLAHARAYGRAKVLFGDAGLSPTRH